MQRRIVEQLRDIPVPVVIEELTEAPRVAIEAREQQRMGEQHTSEQLVRIQVPVVIEELTGAPRDATETRAQRHTVEQHDEFPVAMVVKELTEAPTGANETRVQRRTATLCERTFAPCVFPASRGEPSFDVRPATPRSKRPPAP